jgi:cytochrome c553
MRTRILIACLLLFNIATAARAQDAGVAFFEQKIRPALVEHCYECHSSRAKKGRGGLLLDSRDGVRTGGVNGPAIVPGNPDKSLLIQAIRFTDGATKMPKKGKLPAAIIADFEAWVKMGAPDPRDKVSKTPTAKSWDDLVRERRQWWSLQAVKKSHLPTPKDADWSNQAIDRFLLAKMETKGLTPAKDADPRTLIRRLSLVLTGLPPRAREVESFAKAWDKCAKPQATVEHLVDRLLASPHFGERWARHWMDVVRFTETHGNEWNYDVHHAWRYRDYLIRAFNEDVPYDQFAREHLAGDLLPQPRVNAKERFNESIIGPAFYRFGEVNHDDCIDLRSIGYDLVDNQIDTLTKAFQAMTVACARCHDHKLDAISTRDYHGLLGILRSSRQVAHTIDTPDVNAKTMQEMRAIKAAIRNELADAWLDEVRAPLFLQALAAMKDDAFPAHHPLKLWTTLRLQDKESFAEAWKKVTNSLAQGDASVQDFVTLADFRDGSWCNWQVDGQGLRGAPDGKSTVAAFLPPGAFTHALSDKLNGALRSTVLIGNKKYISFHVLGDQAAAVRLVSNNCQLNYRNFRYLGKNELSWITFPIPADAGDLRVYAEIMTKFDNPKFPDQLGSLGGGKNDRVLWDKAAAEPRSHFGVTQVVLHDKPNPPTPSTAHLRGILAGAAPGSLEELTARYGQEIEASIRAWRTDKASDGDAIWLNAFLKAGILSNRTNLTPKLEKLLAEYRRLDGELTLPRVVPGFADFGPGFDQRLLARGDCMKPGEKISRQFVEVLSSAPFTTKGSGRLELAQAIASADNPLTARVMVNRVWHHLFGTGMVRTVDDFGHVGELPSHPELLDYLAERFAAEGWSIKRLIRAIVLTRTFQLSHTPSAAMLEADPENRLLTRYPARRMEAEAIRDTLLATSSRLDPTLFGQSIPAYREKEYADRRLFKGPLDGAGRRSIYVKVTLMEAPKFLEVFNFPGSKVCQGRRDMTNTPAQALAMLNDPFVHSQAEAWAKRLIERKSDTLETRIDVMLRTALSRPAQPLERARFERFVSQIAELHGVSRDDVMASSAVWRDVAHAVFNLSEFISIP